MHIDLFLENSRKLARFAEKDKNLFNYHIVRYKFFYDNSTLRHKCKYCIMTYKLSMEENELDKLRELGYEIKDS